MKIPQSIIDKYKLAPSNEQVGQSFIQNLVVYKSELPGCENVLFMECDMKGNPSKYITLFNKSRKNNISVSPEYLNDMPIVDVLKFVV